MPNSTPDTSDKSSPGGEVSREQHTPEPWKVEQVEFADKRNFREGVEVAIETDDTVICNMDYRDQQDANARRIVACVNACQNIPTAALENGVIGELVAELGYAKNVIRDYMWWKEDNDAMYEAIAKIDAALAKLKDGGK